MTMIDWILLGVLGLSALLGLWRGLVYETVSLGSWVLAFFVAPWVAPWLAPQVPLASPEARYVAALVGVFLLVVLVGTLLAAVLKRLLSAIGLGLPDRLLGGLFGVVRGALLLLLVALVVEWTPVRQAAWWRTSMVAALASSVLQELRPMMPQDWGKVVT